MIAADQRLSVRQAMRDAVAELRAAAARRRRRASAAAGTRRTRSSRARRRRGTRGSASDLRVEMRQAARDFFRCRLVVGRRAAHGGGDERVAQPQPVVGCAATWGCWRSPRGAAPPSGSRPMPPTPSPVNTRPVRFAPCAAGARPMISRRARGSPNPGTGLRPVRVVAVRAAFLAADPRAVRAQPRTALARHDRSWTRR